LILLKDDNTEKIAYFAIKKSAKCATLKTTKIAASTLSCSNHVRLSTSLTSVLIIQNWTLLISNIDADYSDFGV